MQEVMPALIRHLHDFAREVDLTVDEWATGVSLVNWAGQMSTDKRNEGQLLCDVVGLESYVFVLFSRIVSSESEPLMQLLCRLVDEITYVKAAEATDVATQSAILGPFFREDHPVRQKGADISFDTPKNADVSRSRERLILSAKSRTGRVHARQGLGRSHTKATRQRQH